VLSLIRALLFLWSMIS